MDEYVTENDERYPDFSDMVSIKCVDENIYKNKKPNFGFDKPIRMRTPMGGRGAFSTENFVSAVSEKASSAANAINGALSAPLESCIYVFMFMVLVIIFTCCYVIHGVRNIYKELHKLRKRMKRNV
jgi:hypothetical protein